MISIAEGSDLETSISKNQGGHSRKFRRTSSWTLSALFLAPSAAFITLFLFLPVAEAFRLSFFDWNGLSATMNFVGVQTFIDTWTDTRLLSSLWLTIVWWVLHVVLAIGGGLFLAVLIANLRRGQGLFRTLAFLPHVLSLSVVGVIWAQLYDPGIGLLNQALNGVGLSALATPWLGDPQTALAAVAVTSAWQAFGFYMVIYLAAIQNIDPGLYEAARVDGASAIQQFRHITLPSLHNATTVVLILGFISALKGFGSVWAMTQGGPGTSTELISVYLYRQAFQYGEVSRAAAGGLTLGFLVIILTVLFNRWRDRRAEA